MNKVVSSNRTRLKTLIGSLVTLVIVVAFSLSSDSVNRYLQQISAYQWDKVTAELINPEGDPLKSFKLVDQRYHLNFRYQYQSTEYRGHLVSLAVQNDMSYKEWRRIAHRVRFWHEKGTLKAYVNPRNPSEAVLDPGLNISDAAVVLVMLLVFAFSSLWGVYSSLRGYSSNSARSHQKDGVSDNSLTMVFLCCILGVALMVLPVGGAFDWDSDISLSGIINLAMVTPFVLFGATLMYFSYKMYLDYRILGPVKLNIVDDALLKQMGVLEEGLALAQRIVGGHFHLDVNAVEPLEVELECVHVYSSDDSNSVHKDVIWKERRRCRVEFINDFNQQGYKVSFLFALSDDLPGTGRYSGYRGRIEWSASCSGKVTPRYSSTSIPFARSWMIPVEVTSDESSESRSEITQESSRKQTALSDLQRDMPVVADPEIPVVGAKQTLDVVQDRKGVHVVSSGRYALWVRVLSLLPGVGIIAFSAFVAFVGWLLPEIGLMIAAGVGGVIGLVVMLFGAMFTGMTLKTTAAPNELKKRHCIFGIPVKQKKVVTETADQLTLEYRPLMNSDPEGFGVVRYLVHINNKVEIVAQGFSTKCMAETMLHQLRARL
ncbi:hypothetical protein ACFOEK_19870 [Litoribrevibacter euphylliae]|uniref:DUF3592 domain-containing protein n=1 Tax=Litoribrevibacter euphylliae TaxID=1834034 RepID=A0ABV7HL21_9GAMM